MRRKPCYIRVPIQISNRVRDLKERSISRRLLPGSTCRLISFTTWHFGTDLSYPIRSNDQSGMAASAFSKGCRWYFIFRNLNNSRIIRRIRDFRILDVDVSPHLNSYKTVSTPLCCRFDCASILFDFICPVHVVGCLTVLIECRDNCQDMLILRGQIACSEYWTRRTAGSLCAKTAVCIR